jgi:polyhydroxyalkanoate synthesis regulator phasin
MIENMKENMKDVLLMGLGALSLTGEKANELKKELLERGESLYKEGSIKNEELKRSLKDKIKENTNIKVTTATKEEIVDIINSMSDEEKEEISSLLKNNTDMKDEVKEECDEIKEENNNNENKNKEND